jgi:hypothetical protein
VSGRLTRIPKLAIPKTVPLSSKLEWKNGPQRPVLLKLQSAAVQQSGLVCGMAIDPNDYYVITSRRGEHPDRWSWEIRRKSKPLGIKMTGDGYQSDMAAQFAGNQALADFLSDLSKEDKRPRK